MDEILSAIRRFTVSALKKQFKDRWRTRNSCAELYAVASWARATKYKYPESRRASKWNLFEMPPPRFQTILYKGNNGVGNLEKAFYYCRCRSRSPILLRRFIFYLHFKITKVAEFGDCKQIFFCRRTAWGAEIRKGRRWVAVWVSSLTIVLF